MESLNPTCRVHYVNAEIGQIVRMTLIAKSGKYNTKIVLLNGREGGQSGWSATDDADVASLLLLAAFAGSFHG